ncbi:MAG TPA: hypothetical protein PL187_09815 [Caldilinea sp.]|nr:hypothetical protein [Caldilinea sp.]
MNTDSNPVQFTAPTLPAWHDGGNLTALVTPLQDVAGSLLLSAALPAGVSRARLAGRYFLARCVEPSPWARAHDWTLYRRRPLFVAGWRPATAEAAQVERWLLTSAARGDAGVHWLAARPEGAAVNLIGPLGNGFVLPPRARHLAIVSEPARVAALLPLLHEMLDRGGRTVILLQGSGAIPPALRDLLPFAAEVQQVAADDGWQERLQDALGWADVAATALPASALPEVLQAVRTVRLRVERDFVQALVDVQLVCGYGACHACLTPLGNGRWTRACVHGPVFDLADLGR